MWARLNKNIYELYYKCTGKLYEFISSIYISDNTNNNEKKTLLYFDWLLNKSEKFITEDQLSIPYQYLPKKINDYEYNRLSSKAKVIVDSSYNKLDEKGSKIYKRVENKASILPNAQILFIVNEMVFTRGKVIWVDFGFNIGSEFGGIHPALILKKVGDNLLVLPISSGVGDFSKDYNVEIPIIYKFKKLMPRWTSVHRIQQISPKRILFTDHGSINNQILKKIDEKLRRNL